MTKFPTELIALVTDHYPILQPEVRRTLVQNIILMRNRGLVDAIPLLRLCFEVRRLVIVCGGVAVALTVSFVLYCYIVPPHLTAVSVS